MKLIDYLVIIAVLLLAATALWRWKKKKGCCGNCQGCQNTFCNEKEKEQEKEQ